MSFFEMFVLLIAGHFLADYVFQSNEIALGKNHTLDPARHGVPWHYWMLSHALTHGITVFIVTQNLWLLLLETFFHFLIDYFKCGKHISIHQDQFFHILCKIYWVMGLWVFASL